MNLCFLMLCNVTLPLVLMLHLLRCFLIYGFHLGYLSIPLLLSLLVSLSLSFPTTPFVTLLLKGLHCFLILWLLPIHHLLLYLHLLLLNHYHPFFYLIITIWLLTLRLELLSLNCMLSVFMSHWFYLSQRDINKLLKCLNGRKL